MQHSKPRRNKTKEHNPMSNVLRSRKKTEKSVIAVATVSRIVNCESSPNVNNIRKNKHAQNGAPGKVATAVG